MKRILRHLAAGLVSTPLALGAVAFADQPHTVGHPFSIFSHAHAAASTTGTGSAKATPSLPNPVAQIQQITVNDLNAAIADATAHNDTRHLPCWQAILPIVQANSLPVHLPTALGAAELAQTYFDAKAGINGLQASLDPVVTACALTMADLQMGIIQFGAAIGLHIAPLALPAGL